MDSSIIILIVIICGFVAFMFFFGGSDVLSSLTKTAETVTGVVENAATSAGGIINESIDATTTLVTNPIGATGDALLRVGSTITGSAKPCGSKRNRGTDSKDPEGTACSWWSRGTLCYLHTRKGKWKCDESCAEHRNCCRCPGCEWDSENKICLTTG